MNIESLRKELAQVVEEQKDILSHAEEEKREISESEYKEIDSLIERGNQIKLLVKQDQRVHELAEWSQATQSDPQKPDVGGEDGAYRGAPPKGFRDVGNFLVAVAQAEDRSAKIDRRLTRAASGHNEAIPADGGFLVQTDFSTKMLDLAFKTGKLAGMCDPITISNTSNSVKVPGINETSRADGSRQGGVQVYMKDEAAAKEASTTAIRQVQLTLNKLTGLTYVTDELIQDAPALGSWIMGAFPREFGFKVDDLIMNGTGGGQPRGITNSGALISVGIETGQAAATIIAENVMKMYSRMLPDSIPNATWFINQECWPQLFQLSVAVGTGGVPIFLPPNQSMANAPYGTLLGRPIMPIEQCAALGTVGDIVFADLSFYYFATKGGIKADSSIHVKFTTDETAYRWVYRLDGQPKLASAITPYKGTGSTLSPFVALAERA